MYQWWLQTDAYPYMYLARWSVCMVWLSQFAKLSSMWFMELLMILHVYLTPLIWAMIYTAWCMAMLLSTVLGMFQKCLFLSWSNDVHVWIIIMQSRNSLVFVITESCSFDNICTISMFVHQLQNISHGSLHYCLYALIVIVQTLN